LKSCRELTVPLETGARTTALVYQAHRPNTAFIVGHGAGAGQQSAFMVNLASALAEAGIDVITFNFLYTEQGRRIPDRGPILEACYRAVIQTVLERVDSARRSLFIGGKSMGGRISTQVAAAEPSLPVAGLVVLGYPLHPPGRPETRRDAHLPAVGRPMLFIQGSRDTFGMPGELKPVFERMTPVPTLHIVDGGDHSFNVPGRDPAVQAAVHLTVRNVIVAWVRRVGTWGSGDPSTSADVRR